VDGANGTHDGVLAFDASGTTDCSGAPIVCAPLWIASFTNFAPGLNSAPTVANGVLFIGGSSDTATDGLYAFDGSGVSNCSGTPVICAPLFSYSTGAANVVWSDIMIANGIVYITEATPFGGVSFFVTFKLG
jgi:hypothetical protein